MEKKFSRRQFFRLKPWDHLNIDKEEREEEKEVHYFRPPGALNEKDFLDTCQRCHSCSTACPHGVIDHLKLAEGGISEGTPVIYPNAKACYWCLDMPCIKACPSGALIQDDNKYLEPIGKVKMNEETCLIGQGAICDSCATACPSTIKAIKMKGRFPKLDEDVCVGCGLCVPACPSSPTSLKVLPLTER